jgi:acyl-CoA dehydrogenase
MVTLGGGLKRREKITGRLADVLAWSYLASAALKRFHDDGAPGADLPLVRFGCETALERAEAALAGILRNLPSRPAAWLLRPLVLPLGRREAGPDDACGGDVARSVLDDAAVRERLTAGIHLPPEEEPGIGRLDAALADAKAALPVEAKLRRAVREGRLVHAPGDALAAAAREIGVLGDGELALLRAADRARDEAIQVDAFAPGAFPHPGRPRGVGGAAG